MDPIKQILEPTTEVRKHASRWIDEYGEEWIMLDGVETKVPRIKNAKVLLARQDALRVEIRKELDEKGLRDGNEMVEMTLEDGTKTTVELVPPGKANYLQIGNFGDAAGLFENAARVQAQRDSEEAEAQRVEERAAEQAWLRARSPFIKIRDAIIGLLRKDPQ